MIFVAVVIAITMPLVRWVVLSGAVAGTLLGGALILIRRRRRSEAKAEGLHDI
jgi:LPXTG-motif cell wall-anchored protein